MPNASKYKRRLEREAAGLCKPRQNIGFAYHVTPLWFAQQATEACKRQVNKDIADSSTDTLGRPTATNGVGWKQILSERVSTIIDVAPDAITRRVWSIENGQGKMTKAATLEAMVLASGLLYGVDVNVPELPGNPRLAREVAEVYVELTGDDVNVEQLANELYEFANACWQNWPEGCTHVPDDEVLKVNNLEFLAQIKELVQWPSS